MILDKIFKVTTLGKTQEWEIEVVGNSYRTIVGQKDGKKITSQWTVCAGKNIGKSNETTPEQQALLEATAARRKKLEKDYTENEGEKTTFLQPMLADDYVKGETKLTFPVYVQPKLDGVRCLCLKDYFKSRNGKILPTYISPSDFEFTVDGELYEHGKDFNFIISEVKKPKTYTLKYHVYDIIIPDTVFSKRYEVLSKATLPANWELVPTYLVNTQEELDAKYDEFKKVLKYEGLMIRLDKSYEHKRTGVLLKMKEFKDAEFPVLDIVEGKGNRRGTAGYIVTKTKDGKKFRSNIEGPFEYLAEILKDKDKYIGGSATIEFFEYSKDKKIPRFPIVKSFKREEYE